jgi:hypothetical protein
MIAVATFMPLVLSGYLLQTSTSTTALDILSWGHLALGLICAAALPAHRIAVKGRRRKRPGALPVLPQETYKTEVLDQEQ